MEEPKADWEARAAAELAAAEMEAEATDWAAGDLEVAATDSEAAETDLVAAAKDSAVVEKETAVHLEEPLEERSARLVSCIWHTKQWIPADWCRESVSNKYPPLHFAKCIH